MVDGIRAIRGYAVGIAVADVPGLIQLVQGVADAWEIRGNSSSVDINHPCALHGICIVENPCYGIIRVKFKEIAGKSRSYIAVILLISSHIPISIRHIGYNCLLFLVLNEFLTRCKKDAG